MFGKKPGHAHLARPGWSTDQRLRAGPVIKLVYRLNGDPFDPVPGGPLVEALYARGTPPMWWTSSLLGAEQPVWTGCVSGSGAADLLRLDEAVALERAFATLAAESGRGAVGRGRRARSWPRRSMTATATAPSPRGRAVHGVRGVPIWRTRMSFEHLAPVWTHLSDLRPVRGAGVHLFDADGVRWTDFTSGIGVVNTGHARKASGLRRESGLEGLAEYQELETVYVGEFR